MQAVEVVNGGLALIVEPEGGRNADGSNDECHQLDCEVDCFLQLVRPREETVSEDSCIEAKMSKEKRQIVAHPQVSDCSRSTKKKKIISGKMHRRLRRLALQLHL